jgi:mRNA-degrading endonuclease toxin of MazEF toxin-antitoxin module
VIRAFSLDRIYRRIYGDIWTVKHPVYGSEQVVLVSGALYNRQARVVFAAPIRTLVDSPGYSVSLAQGGYAAIDSMRMLSREDLIEQSGRLDEMDITQIKIVLAVIFDLNID